MKHYNILVPAYRGMINLLYDTAIRFQQTDFLVGTDVQLMQYKINNVIHLCEGFAGVEEKYIWPIIESREQAAAIGRLRCLDKRNLDMLYAVGNDLLQYQLNKGTKTGNDMSKDFTKVMVLCIDGLEKKEELARKNLPQVYTGIEIAYIWHQLLYAVSAEEASLFYQWTLRSLNEEEIAYCLKAVGQSGSNDLCLSMLKAAEKYLSAGQWERVQNAVAEGALLA